MSDAPEPTHGSERGSLRCLGCLAALVVLGACLWSITPKFLKVHWRNQLLTDPTYPATVLAVKHSRRVTTSRVLKPGEALRPGEIPGTRQRGTTAGTITEDTARHEYESRREDGTVAPWPMVALVPGDEELLREELLEVTVSSPSFSDQPVVWRDFNGSPDEWLPGTPCRINAHIKGWSVEHVPATGGAPVGSR